MRAPLVVLSLLVLALPGGLQAAAKPPVATPPNVPGLRQGGDTIETATVIDQLPYAISGTTTGYTDDYDEVCPYSGSTSPDVVYVIELGASALPCTYTDVDLWGSHYDTKVYVYDSALELVACNDDYYPDYTSKIESLALLDSQTYFIVIDGYGGDHGAYELEIFEYAPCYVICHPGQWPEGETLQDGQPDLLNSGCDGDPASPAIQTLPATPEGTLDLCGGMGWITVDGTVQRDVDWFAITIGPSGTVDGVFDDNLGGDLQVITPGECGDLEIQQTIDGVPCLEQELTITGPPGAEVWLRIDTPDVDPECGGYTPQNWDYWLRLSGLQVPVAARAETWSTVKGRFLR